MNLTVIKQWFSLFFRGEVEMVHLNEEWVRKFLVDLVYNKENVYIVEALYYPLLNVVQIVAKAPQPGYARIAHLSAEQYIRVISQALFLLISSISKDYPDILEMLEANPEAAYYREKSLRFKRLIRPSEPFVVTIGLTNIRTVKGIWQMKTFLADGPFVGKLDTVFISGESTAIASKGLEEACYTLWQEIAHRFKSMILTFATSRLVKRRLFFIKTPTIA